MHICGMRWQTSTQLPTFPFQINYGDGILLLGSCFAENIGERLSRYKLNTVQNPFGIVYNPLSMAQVVSFLCGDETFTEKNLTQANELFFSYLHHSRFSGNTATEVLTETNKALLQARKALATQKVAFISLGTAFYWQLNETGEIVNNCHKQPSKLFTQKRASVVEVEASLTSMVQSLREKNPALQIVFTISPIRHLKHGSAQNQLSKATLLVGAHALAEQFDFVHYFPSYELLLDDLRDYRFYAEDLIHPNKIAIDYIWDAFGSCFFSAETNNIILKIEKINQLFYHRTRHAKADDLMKTGEKLGKMIDEVEREAGISMGDMLESWYVGNGLF